MVYIDGLSFVLGGFVLACFKGLKMVDSSHPTFSKEDASGQCVTVWTSTGTQPLVLKGTLEVIQWCCLIIFCNRIGGEYELLFNLDWYYYSLDSAIEGTCLILATLHHTCLIIAFHAALFVLSFYNPATTHFF